MDAFDDTPIGYKLVQIEFKGVAVVPGSVLILFCYNSALGNRRIQAVAWAREGGRGRNGQLARFALGVVTDTAEGVAR